MIPLKMVAGKKSLELGINDGHSTHLNNDIFHPIYHNYRKNEN
jgi:hypothetical protein